MPLDHTGSSAVSNDACSDWIRQYRSQKRRCDEEQGVLRNIIKRAKSDGINARAMIAAVNATKQDPEVIAADLRDQIRYMGLIHLPVSQGQLFEGWDDAVTAKTQHEDDLWDAEDAGYRAGRHGVPSEESPYAVGTELHVHWLSEWHKGQASIARELGENVKRASSARERPAREQPGLHVVQNDDEQADRLAQEDKAKPVIKPAAVTNGTAAKRGRPRKDQGNGASASAAN